MSDEEDNIDKKEDQAPAEDAAAADAQAQDGGETEAEAMAAEMADGIKLEDMNNMGDDEEDGEDEFAPGEPMAKDVEAIYDIPVQISAVLGRSTMQVSQLLKLGRGAVVELDRKVGEAIDIYVNNRLVARGEVVVVDDKLGVTMTEIVKADRT